MADQKDESASVTKLPERLQQLRRMSVARSEADSSTAVVTVSDQEPTRAQTEVLEAFLDQELTPAQKKVMKAFLDLGLTPAQRDYFSAAFDMASKNIPLIEAAERELSDTTYKPQRARYERKIRKLNDELARLTTHHQKLYRLAVWYAEQRDGEIENISDLIDYLRTQGVLTVTNCGGRSSTLTERAIRIRLNALGIKGKRGRKPR